MGRDCVQTPWACRTGRRPSPAFDLRNRIGSDVHRGLDDGQLRPKPGNISAVPVQAAAQASHPSVSGAKFDRCLLRRCRIGPIAGTLRHPALCAI
jgi:hypothetical protein